MCSEIDEALAMIRDRFPSNTFPYLSLEQVNSSAVPALAYLPSNNKVSFILLYHDECKLQIYSLFFLLIFCRFTIANNI